MPQLSPARLANIHQFMAQNPAMAQALIQQIAATNPALLQQLGENPQQFLAGILESAAAEDLGEDDEEGPVPPGATVLNVTPEERAAIERVCIPRLPQRNLQSYGLSLTIAGGSRIPPAACYRGLLCVR